jgi:integrase
MKRQANPQFSSAGARALTQYEQTLHLREDLTLDFIRNYLSDLRHFIEWHEAQEALRSADTQSKAKHLHISPHDLRHRFGYRMAESVSLHGWLMIR